jgi:hypothetical protein
MGPGSPDVTATRYQNNGKEVNRDHENGWMTRGYAAQQ